MEFNWEEISKKLTSAADYTVKKTEKLTAMAKLEYKLASAKNKLNLLYQSMGKMKFSEIAGEQVPETAYRELFDKIAALLIMVERMEEELAKLRNYRFCVACGAKIGNDMAFCPKCGTRQEPADEEEAEAVVPEALTAPDMPAPAQEEAAEEEAAENGETQEAE